MFLVLIYEGAPELCTSVYGPFKTEKAAKTWARENVREDDEAQASFGQTWDVEKVQDPKSYKPEVDEHVVEALFADFERLLTMRSEGECYGPGEALNEIEAMLPPGPSSFRTRLNKARQKLEGNSD